MEIIKRNWKPLALITFALMGSLAVGGIKDINFGRDWAQESRKESTHAKYQELMQYICGTNQFTPRQGEGYWNYALEDVKNNPELNKITGSEATSHIAELYKTINNGNMQFGETYQRPIWCFE